MSGQAQRSGDAGNDDPDGVRVVRRHGAGRRARLLWQGLALFLVAGCVGYAMTPSVAPSKRPDRPAEPAMSETDKVALEALMHDDDASAAAPAAAAAPSATAPSAASAPAGRRAPTPRRRATAREDKPSDLTPEQQQLAEKLRAEGRKEVGAGEYIQALHDAGIYEGIGAFQPPGTSPPLEGLSVPEDFELPEGYVRHFQATDDGQAIEPILMFDPSYDFFDAAGNPIPLPDDLVVRPEHVPDGFPIRPIAIPTPREPGDVSR